MKLQKSRQLRTQKRKKSTSAFTKNSRNGNSSALTSPSPITSPAGRIYTTTSSLPLNKFIVCLCDNDLSQLIIEGNPPQGELVAAWYNLYEEFLDAMQDKEGVHKIRLLETINKLQLRHDLIVLCVSRLRVAFNEEVLNTLRGLIHVSGSFDTNDSEAYYRNLQVIENRLGTIRLQIEEKKAEYAVLTNKDEEGSKPTRKNFDSLIAQVERFTHFHIDEEKTTVSRFCQHYVAMKEISEAHAASLKKIRR